MKVAIVTGVLGGIGKASDLAPAQDSGYRIFRTHRGEALHLRRDCRKDTAGLTGHLR